MNNSPKGKKLSNLSVPGELKIKKGLVKLDLGELEKVIQDLYNQNQVLRDKIDSLEIILNRDDQLEMLRRAMDEINSKNTQHSTSIDNISAKIISIEKEYLNMDRRTVT